MLAVPECHKRGCIHYAGILSGEDGSEVGERPVCAAFPDGIPDIIAYGDELHTKHVNGQTGNLVYTDGAPHLED
jgi:hypothetical protein